MECHGRTIGRRTPPLERRMIGRTTQTIPWPDYRQEDPSAGVEDDRDDYRGMPRPDHRQEDPSAGAEDDADDYQVVPRPDHRQEDPSAGAEDDREDYPNNTMAGPSAGGPLRWSGG
ncbi:uncharacterized protein LOC101853279 [Aplysia californica]|uniref:Uncharacterized protein LOC101853279 n=1 Tax=Aplysia californica TaxID=6500 RepID=A0ABM1W3S8_APLCA|nr:uncharacterized protein LOC101853279 [Aplysia californica]